MPQLPLRLAALALLAGSISLRAQQPRLTIAPLVGRADPSSIYDHTIVFPPASSGGSPVTSVERLSVNPATTVGATVDFRVGASWVLSARASRGSSKYEYFQRDESGGLVSQNEERGPAEVTSAALTLGRRFDAVPLLTYLDLFAGGSLQVLNVRPFPGCGAPPPPPSAGVVTVPFGCDAWHHRYSAPGVIGGAQLHRRIAEHWGFHGGGSFSLSRADTKVFWTDLLPQYDQYEAPKSHRLHAVQWSLGLAYYR